MDVHTLTNLLICFIYLVSIVFDRNLSRNKVEVLPPGLCRGLLVLSIVQFCYEYIVSNVFFRSLSMNKIIVLPPGLFRGLHALTNL